jgi:hypothetical protein
MSTIDENFVADGEAGKSVVPGPVDTGSTKRPADKSDNKEAMPKLTKAAMVAKMVELVHAMPKESISKAYTSVIKALKGPTDMAESFDLEEELTEGTLDKLDLSGLQKRHMYHHENGGGSDRSYQAMDAIEKHVKKKYGEKAHKKLVDTTDDYAAGGGAGPFKGSMKESNEAVNGVVLESFNAIFEGTGVELDESFAVKASAIFEAAVTAKAGQLVLEAQEKYEADLQEAVQALEEQHKATLEAWTERVISEWVEMNKAELKSSIRYDILESFTRNLRDLFVEHYIDIPEEAVDVVEQLNSEVEDLKRQLEEAAEITDSLNEELARARAEAVFNEVCEGLTVTQVEKMRSLSESFDYASAEEYRVKLDSLRESAFISAPKGQAQVQLSEEADIITEDKKVNGNIDPEVARVAMRIR